MARECMDPRFTLQAGSSPGLATGSTRAAAAAAAAPPRVTLLSLPDEILAQVFTALHTRYQHRKIGTPPTHFLQICKRLYAIARPIWLSVLVVPEPKTDEYCAKMLEHPTARAHVKDLQLQLEADPPAWKLALFLHLSKLQTLRLRETSGKNQVRVTYSNEAMLAVESLTTLSHLHILSPKTGLIRMSPRPLIRKMDLPISSHVLLNFRSLEQLTLRIDVDSDPTECEYNWDTLNALEFIVDPQLSSTPELFLRKVANQVRIPLLRPSRSKLLIVGLVTRLVKSKTLKDCSASRSYFRRQTQPTTTFAKASLHVFLGRRSKSSSLIMDLIYHSPARGNSPGRF